MFAMENIKDIEYLVDEIEVLLIGMTIQLGLV